MTRKTMPEVFSTALKTCNNTFLIFQALGTEMLHLRVYLSGILTAIAQGHKQANIKDLLLWNYVEAV